VANRFELRWSVLRRRRRVERAFLDYVIDGRSLWADRRVGEFRQVPLLGWLPSAADDEAAARLLLDAPPDLGDRTAIFVCGSCGDLDCGATSVVIERDGDEIVWRDPGATSRVWGREALGRPMWPDAPDVPWSDRFAVEVFRDEEFRSWPDEWRFDAQEYRRAIAQRPVPLQSRRARR
jgi:hypothetical protein